MVRPPADGGAGALGHARGREKENGGKKTEGNSSVSSPQAIVDRGGGSTEGMRRRTGCFGGSVIGGQWMELEARDGAVEW